tara:strand:+ start:1782 stop:2408 length:627 start_codon:yes stop_codon:yes gene_type:complete
MQNYIGFYWTLPVPWAGFRDLPNDADEASGLSRTIRYQRDRVRRWVKEEKGELIDETVFLETEPDRGSDLILPVVEKLLDQCREQGARLVLVNFTSSCGWRQHHELWCRLHELPELVEPLDPIPLPIDGEVFDPVSHFRQWQKASRNWASGKADRVDFVAGQINELFSSGLSHRQIAEALNDDGVLTPASDRPWTKDNVRKFLKDRLK